MDLGRPQTSPTGLVMWPIVGTAEASLIWLGPGSGLFLGINATSPQGIMTAIDHPSANGTYDTRLEAARAARRFVTREAH